MRRLCEQLDKLIIALQIVISDCASFFTALLRTRAALAAENLFLRKQLALFQERDKKAKATTPADRLSSRGSLAYLTGARLWSSCNRPRLSAGTGRRSADFGVGSRDLLEDHQFLSN